MTRLFGTNGIRGVVGEGMTADLAVGIGRAVGTFFNGGPVALARDTRLSGPMLARAAASGLMSAGSSVIDLGVVPTPCAQYFVAKSGRVKGALIVTASHNPREFNGLKAIDSRGMEMSREDEEAIEAIYFEGRFRVAPWSDVGSIRSDDTAIHRYTEGILSKVDADEIRRRAPMVVLDSGNGAGCVVTPYLLRALGCRVLTLNGQPDGAFPGRMPEPTADHLGDLMRLVPEVHADLGIAHDGDADRATFVDETGAFVVGDKSLALLAGAAVRGRGGTVVTPVSTSSLLDDVVRPSGAKVVRTRVGSPIVGRTMFESGATFGGEENGGVIFPDHQLCRDGAMAAAKMIELIAHAGKPLSALLAALPQYHIQKGKVEVPVEKREAVLAQIVKLAKGRKVDTTDGVKILESDGSVLVRPSGTEPIFRVYAESKDPSRAKALLAEGLGLVGKALGGGQRAQGH
jgi:phosphomannomutase/phosphoglucomutase